MEFKKTYKMPYRENQVKRVEMYCKQYNLVYTDLQIFNGYVTFIGYSNITYENLVNQLIAERYTIQDELAIHRKYSKGVNEAEFNEYDEFVEQCKVRAKEFIAERERVLNGTN